MRVIFTILICFSLGNLNYYLFFQDDSSIKGTIKDLTSRNSEKIDKSIDRIKDNTSKLDQKASLQSGSQKKAKDKALVTQSKSEKKQASVLDEKTNRKKFLEEQFVKESITSEDNNPFFGERNLSEDLDNGLDENKKLKVKKRRIKIKKRLEHLFSEKTYPWVKRISSLKGIESPRNSLEFYPWGFWRGQYLSSDGFMRSITLKINRKSHELKDLAKLNMKVGKGKKLHLAILKNFPLKTSENEGFLNKFHYFSFSIDKEIRLILFKRKKQKNFMGLIKLRRKKKWVTFATFRLKKIIRK